MHNSKEESLTKKVKMKNFPSMKNFFMGEIAFKESVKTISTGNTVDSNTHYILTEYIN